MLLLHDYLSPRSLSASTSGNKLLRFDAGTVIGCPSASRASYNSAGGLQSLSYPNGVTETLTPDAMFRPHQIVVKLPGNSSSNTYMDTGNYVYDGVGNITAMGTDTFGYDLIGRLTSASVHSKNKNDANQQTTYALTWQYDDYGNLLRADQSDGTSSSSKIFQVDPYSNQIVNMGAPLEPFSYDQRGNLTRQYLDPNTTQRFLFDDRNRLVGVAKRQMGNTLVLGEYAYDAASMRFLKENAGSG